MLVGWTRRFTQKLSVETHYSFSFKSLAFEAKGCTNLAEPNTIHFLQKIYSEEGTRLAMPKTIRKPNSSSSKTGSGATEGVLDRGVLMWPDNSWWAGLVGREDHC